jgi:hypothetical protein
LIKGDKGTETETRGQPDLSDFSGEKSIAWEKNSARGQIGIENPSHKCFDKCMEAEVVERESFGVVWRTGSSRF